MVRLGLRRLRRRFMLNLISFFLILGESFRPDPILRQRGRRRLRRRDSPLSWTNSECMALPWAL